MYLWKPRKDWPALGMEGSEMEDDRKAKRINRWVKGVEKWTEVEAVVLEQRFWEKSENKERAGNID